MNIPTKRIEVTVEGDLDLRGTLGISKEAPIGFEQIRIQFDGTCLHQPLFRYERIQRQFTRHNPIR